MVQVTIILYVKIYLKFKDWPGFATHILRFHIKYFINDKATEYILHRQLDNIKQFIFFDFKYLINNHLSKFRTLEYIITLKE